MAMYKIIGYEHIKTREGNEFTKVHVVQKIGTTENTQGYKPFPVQYVESGLKTFSVDVPCNINLDIRNDGKLIITSLTVIDDII